MPLYTPGSTPTESSIGTLIAGATSKTTPVDADSVAISDSAAGGILKKVTWANIKATLKTYFDTQYAPAGGAILRGYISGFGLSYSSTTVLGIAAGYAADSTNATAITGTAFTKSTAGTWAAGTAGNGMGTGLTIANSTWYHVFAIINSGAYDVYFDTSISAANKPASTTAFKRIGSFLTNGSAQIVDFVQHGWEVHWKTQVVEVNGAPPASATLLTLTVPPGVNVQPILSALYYDGTPANNYQAWSPDAGSTAKNEMLISAQVANVYVAASCSTIVTNTSKQIYHKTNGANSPNLLLYGLGWIDPSLANT